MLSYYAADFRVNSFFIFILIMFVYIFGSLMWQSGLLAEIGSANTDKCQPLEAQRYEKVTKTAKFLRNNKRIFFTTPCKGVGTALLRALRLPFGLPFGREHFVVPMPSASTKGNAFELIVKSCRRRG
ncbi:MAG: hypothetical protein IJ160_08325 [Muribaculaceae bacterium]|nr:hypothetical protein [Muribaculaceae bacterium]